MSLTKIGVKNQRTPGDGRVTRFGGKRCSRMEGTIGKLVAS